MLRFVLGIVSGGILALGYVSLSRELPSIFRLPEMLRNNLTEYLERASGIPGPSPDRA